MVFLLLLIAFFVVPTFKNKKNIVTFGVVLFMYINTTLGQSDIFYPSLLILSFGYQLLWMCNGSLPAIAEMQNKTTAVCLGGWLEGLSKNLLRNPDIQLIYCYSDYEISCVQTGARDNLKYYAIPMTRKEANESMSNTSVAYKTFSDILRESQPDIIHFFGTEFVYTDAFLDICIDCGFGDKVVVSIQGLVSKYFLHFDADLPAHVIWSKTLNELKGHASLRNIKKSFRQRGNHECVALKKAKHIIGRTSWDRAVTELIAPETQYHFCNETLRDVFYWRLPLVLAHYLYTCQQPLIYLEIKNIFDLRSNALIRKW